LFFWGGVNVGVKCTVFYHLLCVACARVPCRSHDDLRLPYRGLLEGNPGALVSHAPIDLDLDSRSNDGLPHPRLHPPPPHEVSHAGRRRASSLCHVMAFGEGAGRVRKRAALEL